MAGAVVAFDWSGVEFTGAFIVGFLAGVVAAMRVTRAIMSYLKGEHGGAD